MRTTINLPDELYRAVRVRAAEEDRTVTSFLEEAIRRMLADRASGADYRVRPLRGAAPPAGVDIDDNAALRDLMDAEMHVEMDVDER
jgi:plasmid stability protein